MPRLNVWLPDELAATIRAELPDVNVSKVLQDTLRQLLKCRHDRWVCGACNAEVDQLAYAAAAKIEFFTQLMWELDELVRHGGTAVGAAQVAKSVAIAHQLPSMGHYPLHRPTKAQRRRMEDRQWLAAQQRLLEEAAG